VDTYIDQETGRIHDYGVQVYFPYEDTLDFFARLNLTLLRNPPRAANVARYIDFSTGKELADFRPLDSQRGTEAVRKFLALAMDKGYDKMTQPGYWNLPPGDSIPEDLLLPIGELAKKYSIEPMLAAMYPSTGGGVGSRGDFKNVMTLTLMKSFPVAWIRAFLNDIDKFFVEGGNQRLFDTIAKSLRGSVLYDTVVVAAQRNETGAYLTLENKSGQKTVIVAKKLLLAVQPTLENLAPFDLDQQEKTLFSKAKYGRSQTGIISHSKLPNATTLRNMPAAAVQDPASPFLTTPFAMSISHYGGTSKLYSVGASGSDYGAFGEKQAQATVQLALQKMSEAGTLPDLAGEPLRVVAWSDHEVGGFGVSAGDMREGWMANLYALQGKRSTWFTGGGVAADFTPILWKFNDDLLSRMVKAM